MADNAPDHGSSTVVATTNNSSATGGGSSSARQSSSSSGAQISVHATRVLADGTCKNEELSYVSAKAVGCGSFGTVYSAKLSSDNMQVAIKKVLQDRRFKNRELSIMKRLCHPSVVQLLYYFYSSGSNAKDADVYLNLVMDFVPENVYKQIRYYHNQRTSMPLIFVKLYTYQLFRALNYIHKDNICHRDIKPQNLLCDPSTGQLKLCDFGSAKQLSPEESNVAYICSRYYRAPELILCAVHYTCAIDVWSSGCVLGELLLNNPLFPGESGVDQLVEIIKILGTPNREQIDDMNPQAAQQFRFPPVRPHPWSRYFRSKTPASVISLITAILEFSPQKRVKPIIALNHEFFKELRDPNTKLPNGAPLPYRDLFELKADEMTTMLADAEKQPNGGAGTGGVNPFPMINGQVKLTESQSSVTSSSRPQPTSSSSPPNLSTEEKVKRYISMLQQKDAENSTSTENNM